MQVDILLLQVITTDIISTRRKAAVHTNAISEVTFGASPVNMPASLIHIEVENKGSTPTQWYDHYDKLTVNVSACRAFQFPEDLYLEPVYWAMTGELNQVEKDQVSTYCNDNITS